MPLTIIFVGTWSKPGDFKNQGYVLSAKAVKGDFVFEKRTADDQMSRVDRVVGEMKPRVGTCLGNMTRIKNRSMTPLLGSDPILKRVLETLGGCGVLVMGP